MPYEVQFKPFVEKNGVKYKILEITDIAFHTTHKRPTESIFKKFLRVFGMRKASRFYKPFEPKAFYNPREYILEVIKNDPNVLKHIQEEEENGYKVLIGLPEGGIPMHIGNDTAEFIKSKNGKRFFRGIAKENDSDTMTS